MFYWVLVKVPRGQTHSADQLVPGWRIVEAISLMGFQTKLRKGLPWTIVGNVRGECHAPCIPKNSFVDFETEQAQCSRHK
jgi:hypothetical protein